jgi:integrase
LTVEEVKNLLAVAKDQKRNYAILQMFEHTSQRIHSIMYLNINDISDIPKKTANSTIHYEVTFRHIKGNRQNRKPKKIPIPQECYDAVMDY